jgi:NADPH:quinone reductase
VPVVYDSVGLTTFEGSLRCHRPRGLVALYGASSGAVPPFDLIRLSASGSLFITRPTLADYVRTPFELSMRSAAVFDGVISGSLKLTSLHRYPLSEARQAHIDLEGRRTTGKPLLIP